MKILWWYFCKAFISLCLFTLGLASSSDEHGPINGTFYLKLVNVRLNSAECMILATPIVAIDFLLAGLHQLAYVSKNLVVINHRLVLQNLFLKNICVHLTDQRSLFQFIPENDNDKLH